VLLVTDAVMVAVVAAAVVIVTGPRESVHVDESRSSMGTAAA
jgi:hypothetical protein